jgi:hypothetical protein
MNKFNSIAEFAQANSITQIVKQVRVNANGYSFVTFVTEDNKAINIYFGSSIGSEYHDGQAVTRELLAELQIYAYLTEDGEQRYRLVRKGESVRASLADLL